MQISQAERFAMHCAQKDGKVPLTRIEHVSHLIEGH